MIALSPHRCAVLFLAACTTAVPPGLQAQATPSATQAKPATDNPASSLGVPTWPTHYPDGTGSPLAARIMTVLSDPRVAGAHWGIAVTAMDGTPIYGLDEAKLFRPASSAKLFTTAAAMAILGPESTTTTAVYGALDKDTGVVTGDLVIVGAGDPSFGTSDLPYDRSSGEDGHASSLSAAKGLQALADQLVAQGVRSITGNVVGDATLFSPAAPPEGWAEEDLLWGYGALPSALSIQDNEVAVTVTPKVLREPGETGVGARVQVDQLVPFFKLRANLAPLTSSPAQPDHVQWSRSPADPATVVVNGFVTAGHPPLHEEFALSDPALYTAQALHAQLREAKVQIGGEAVARTGAPHTPQPFLTTVRSRNPCDDAALGEGAGCVRSCSGTVQPGEVLASHTSPALRQEIAFTLKTSANLHAEVLLHRLGLKAACPGADTLDGARVVHTWLLHSGLAEHDFIFYDGSGLSTKDLVTPRAEVQLLAYATKQPWFEQWKAALPVGGVDGTLANRFSQPPLRGNVFAKTGTLGESRALAGYVRCASGRDVVFAILDDDHEPGSSADRITMDKIVEAIAEFN